MREVSITKAAPVASTVTLHRTSVRWRPVLAAGFIALLGAAGCGGSSKGSKAATTPTITRAEFVAKANAICASADPALSAENAKLLNHPRPAAVAAAAVSPRSRTADRCRFPREAKQPKPPPVLQAALPCGARPGS